MNEIIKIENLFSLIRENNYLKIEQLSIYENENVFFHSTPQSGLTSFLKIISGTTFPDQGRVLIMNEDMRYCSEPLYNQIKKQVAYCYQHGVLLSNLTVFENLMLTLNFHFNHLKNSEKAKRIIKNLNRFDLTDILHKRPVDLTFMQKKFIGIFRSFLINPRLVVIDEPFQNFDSDFCSKVEALIEQHFALGGSIIYGSTDDSILKSIDKRFELSDFIVQSK
jgi:ABC-type lipoprotein export system ATPase subunit